MKDFMSSKFSSKVNTVTGFFYYVMVFDQIWPKYTLKSGENPITQRAIKMFTSMKISYNINERFHVFNIFKYRQHSHVVFLLCDGFWPNMTKNTLESGVKPHHPKSYENVYFNENFLQYKWKISYFQYFQVK